LALVQLVDKIATAVNNGDYVRGVVLDFSKTFVIRLITKYYLTNLNTGNSACLA